MLPHSDSTPRATGDEHLWAARDLVTRVRELCDRVIQFPAGESTAAIAARIADVTDEIERVAAPSEVPWFYTDPRTMKRGREWKTRLDERDDDLSAFNPVMPPLRARVRDGRLAGEVTVGPAFSGPPGLVHGGTQATLLDHVMGLLVASTGRPAVTARLEVDYRRGAPIGTELNLAAEVDEVDGRKIRVQGRISSAGEVCAVGHALFVAVPDAR